MGQKERVPFIDLKLQHQGLRGEINKAVTRTLDSTGFILGPDVSEFEGVFARYCDSDYAVGVSSGTAALHLALCALGVGPGDEVITVPNTFIATVEAILYTGASPVLVDVDADSFCMDPESFEEAVTSRTKAVIPVHIFGQPCDMESILAIAGRHGIDVVEDACQAVGATFMGKKAGSFGKIACFSFYPTKNLGTIGDGGAITTSDPEIAAKIKALRHHGQSEPNVFPEVGYNYRMDSLKAAVLNVKMTRIDDWNKRRREIAERYRALSGENFKFQKVVSGSDPVYHIMAVGHAKRSVVQDGLTAAGIGWGKHIVTPIHQQPGYRHVVRTGASLSRVEKLSEELISLPVYPELTDVQLDYVLEVLGNLEVSV